MVVSLRDREQATIDQRNAEFWNELCGTGLAQFLAIDGNDPESLRKFDATYFAMYPYLLDRVPVHRMAGKTVVEVGLGYGTLGQKIAEHCGRYIGLDIAAGPVEMMNHRLRLHGLNGEATVGSVLQCPLDDDSVDCIVSIGCFHHTGNLARCIAETYRVLKPGGEAFVMVYNAFSLRRWRHRPLRTLSDWVRDVVRGGGPVAGSAAERAQYDADSHGNEAPETVFASIRQLRRMFGGFARFSCVKENCDDLVVKGRCLLRRDRGLSILGRAAGLDLYVAATK